jgi:hypothetical protein
VQTWSCKSAAQMSRVAALVVLAGALAPLADAEPADVSKHPFHDGHGAVGMAPLVDKVRVATARFLDINVAKNEGWVPATPCVSGPNAGAMGVHFVLPSRLGDGILNANEPEALIYEPMVNGAMRLVGVEFIVFASDWAALHPDGGTPNVDGHLTNFVDEPNRYGLHAFYELHVWAWEHNPNGSFADWNTRVTCDSQTAPAP